ncbi:carbohydrate-binding protein [Hymenobacter algoricola]|uniref:Carbohydrate-binding protein n=1 Tax=Hymenobacter algoricola TaxID=486267 RepID=A0ABP7NPY2_9BACT
MKRILSLVLLGLLTLTSSYGQAISPYLAGQNAWLPTALGTQVFNGQLDRLWPVVQQSKVRMVRIGGNGVNSNLVTNPQYIALIDSVRRIGAEPMVQVSEGRGRFTAAQAAQVVHHVNITMGRHVKYWIIGNEPDLNNAAHPNPTPVAGVAAYLKAFASAMKAVDPGILIVGPENAAYNSYFPALVGGANDVTGTDASGRYYIDVISFHTYPFAGTQTRAQVVNGTQNLTANVTNLLGLMASANALHNRTGANALRWALTEFNVDYANPTANTVEGVGVHSFLNGQYWAEVFGVGMKYEAVSMQPWSIHEGNGARGVGDLGYLDGSGATIKPRSAFWHEMLVSENMHGTNLNATDNQALVKVLSSTDNGTTAVMLLNESDATDYDFTVQLSTAPVPGVAALKINVPAGLASSYNGKLYAQSTLVLLFNSQGALTKKIVYSLQHAQNTRPPTYLNPGQSFTLATFSADKTFTCVAPEAVNFAATVLGEFTTINWDFGAGATPPTATGKGPVAVRYAAAGTPTVTMTLVNPDTTIVVTRAPLQVSSCVRTPFLPAPAVVPGVVKAVEFDNGGPNVAYFDSDAVNRGAAVDPTVPRANESVDTEKGDGGTGNVGYSASGEWLKYTVNILRTGLYRVTVRVATGATSTGSLRLSVNDVDRTGIVPVPATGGFGTYQDLVINNVYLEASPGATLRFDIVSSSLNFSRLTFEEQPMTGIVVNRLYNATSTGDGSQDAVELLVTQDRLDLRGLIVKDFEANLTSDTGGKYQFKDNPLWKELRIGTTIVLRRLTSGISGYAPDVDPADFKLDLLLENAAYLDALAPAGQNFNLTQTDMVLLKTGSAGGTANAVHAMSSNGGSTAFFAGVASPKLLLSAGLGTGAFVYPLNPTQSAADYTGSSVATSTSASRSWGDGFGTPNVTYINALRNAAFTAPTIVVNRVYNGSNDASGSTDAVELLVVQDHLDLRNVVVKDFESNNSTDNGGKYRFANVALWQDLRLGTTIVLRRLAGPAGYVPDLDAADFTLDLLLENPTYLTNLAPTTSFNITQYDMVLLKTGAATGVDGAIHALATKGGGNLGVPSALFQTVRSPKLTSPDGTDAGGGSFHYPLNPDQQLTDYNGAKGAISKSAALTWGYGFGAGNAAFIQALRDSVLAPPTLLTATAAGTAIALSWMDNAAGAAGFEIGRSTDGLTYAPLATTAAAVTTYSDSCLAFGTRYYYQVRTRAEGLYSRYAAPAQALTGSRPLPVLPLLTDACSVTATAPTAPDNCGSSITATTTDAVQYASQGTFHIAWTFAYADGSTATVPQLVIVRDTLAPAVQTQNLTVELDARGQASIRAAQLDNGSADNCGVAGFALDKATFDCSNVGANLVQLTVTDSNGNTASAPATVTVQDHTAPSVLTRTVSVTLINGVATITAAQVDNGSTDACGISQLRLDRTSFDCSTLGDNPVTLTATDTNGNQASAAAVVTVLGVRPAVNIGVSRPDPTFTGLDSQTLALGYGAQQLTLTAANATSAPGATAYAWLPAEGLSNAASATPVFTPTAAGTYVFTVTATNEFGCAATAAVTITVLDVRCGNKNDKVAVCHNGHALCLSPTAVATHLSQHGDPLGTCSPAAKGTAAPPVPTTTAAARFDAYPNPFADHAVVRFRTIATASTQLLVYNALGQLVATLYDDVAEAGRDYEVPLNGTALPAGLYTGRLLSNGTVATQRLVIVK